MLCPEDKTEGIITGVYPLCIKLNKQEAEIQELKKEALSWMDVAIGKTSSNYAEKLEKNAEEFF